MLEDLRIHKGVFERDANVVASRSPFWVQALLSNVTLPDGNPGFEDAMWDQTMQGYDMETFNPKL